MVLKTRIGSIASWGKQTATAGRPFVFNFVVAYTEVSQSVAPHEAGNQAASVLDYGCESGPQEKGAVDMQENEAVKATEVGRYTRYEVSDGKSSNVEFVPHPNCVRMVPDLGSDLDSPFYSLLPFHS